MSPRAPRWGVVAIKHHDALRTTALRLPFCVYASPSGVSRQPTGVKVNIPGQSHQLLGCSQRCYKDPTLTSRLLVARISPCERRLARPRHGVQGLGRGRQGVGHGQGRPSTGVDTSSLFTFTHNSHHSHTSHRDCVTFHRGMTGAQRFHFQREQKEKAQLKSGDQLKHSRTKNGLKNIMIQIQ